MEREGGGGAGKEGEERKKRDYCLPLLLPLALQTYLCSAVTDTGWVALTFTVNYQWIDCVLMGS